MINLDLAYWLPWLGQWLWALGRVSGLCLVAPVFSSTLIPARIRVMVAMMLTLVVAPMAPRAVDPLSWSSLAVMAQQMLVGAMMGFILKLVFEAVAFGGQLVGQSMSLGFAEVINPQGGGSTPVLGQFYTVLATLLFLSLDGHLQLVAMLAQSFHTMPPGQGSLDPHGLEMVVAFGTQLFSGAVRVALPAVTALLVVNIGFAAISRAAPSMNLFAVGFPITICLGSLAVWVGLRSLPGALESLLNSAWALLGQLIGA